MFSEYWFPYPNHSAGPHVSALCGPSLVSPDLCRLVVHVYHHSSWACACQALFPEHLTLNILGCPSPSSCSWPSFCLPSSVPCCGTTTASIGVYFRTLGTVLHSSPSPSTLISGLAVLLPQSSRPSPLPLHGSSASGVNLLSRQAESSFWNTDVLTSPRPKPTAATVALHVLRWTWPQPCLLLGSCPTWSTGLGLLTAVNMITMPHGICSTKQKVWYLDWFT